jgi:ligand-binding sensor domain-containing protein
MLRLNSIYQANTISKLILAIFLLGIGMQSSAQSGRQVLKHLSTKDGLSSNEVRKVLEDSYGFIWFATSDGLCRWDGYEFKVFKNYNNDSNSLPNYFLLCLEEDISKNIWIGTNHGGLTRYNTVEDRFYRYSSIKDDENSIPGMVVRCVFKDSKQNIWIGTHSGLAKYNPESDNFTRFSVSGDNSEIDTDIRQIFQVANNEIIIQSDAGFFKLNIESKILSRYEFNLPGIDEKVFLQNNPACFDSQGNLWIGSPEGLFRLDLVNGNFRKYLPDANKSNCINSVNFSVIFEDSRSNIWIGSENRGLNIYNRESDDFTHLEAGLSKNNISNNIISDIYEDKHSTIWISTLEGGVNYFSFKQAMFEHFYHDPFEDNSLSGNRIAAFCEDDSGFIWIGTEDGGLNKYSAKDNNFTRYRLNSEFIAPSIMSIEKHAQNEFFISGLRVGLYNFNSKTGKFSNLMMRENSSTLRSGMQITDLLTDSKGLLWMSTHDKEGIMIYNPDLKQYYSAVNPGFLCKRCFRYSLCCLFFGRQ